MKFGRYEITLPNHGFFRLDGGAMFGAVPKNLWARSMPADSENCIRLATRSLLLKDGERNILVDVGNGNKWSEKLAKIFGIENTPEGELGFSRDEITDIILTHLHFDHAGGISYYTDSGELALSYPSARMYLQRANFENGKNPNLREKASYLANHINILEEGKLELLDGDGEVLPDIFVKRVDGHTIGQQYLEIRSDHDTILYPTDLCPTSHHLPLPYNMGYDMCTKTLLEEKEAFLSYAVEKNAIVVFEHDPELAAARIHIDDRGHYGVKEEVSF